MDPVTPICADIMTEQDNKEKTLGKAMRSHGDNPEQGAGRKFPTVTDIAVMLLLFFASQVLGAFLSSSFGLRMPDVSSLATDDVESYMRTQVLRGETIAILYPLSMSLALLFVALYVRFRSGRMPRVRWSASGFNPNIILSGIVWVVVAQIVLEPLMNLLPSVTNEGVGRGMWACLTAVVMAPVFEETLCRGIVLETLRRRWSNGIAVAVSALFFGIVHVEPATALAGIVVGAILGTIYVRTSSIFSAIILHAINNAVAFALICFDMNGLTLYQMLGGGTLYYVVYGISLLLFVLFCIESYRKVFSSGRTNGALS